VKNDRKLPPFNPALHFHKSIKSNTSMAKSPARTVRTQSNPIFMSLYATARLEILSAQQGLNKFADMKIGLLCVLTVLAGDFAMLVFDFMLL
jgi:hypothetical protein